MNNTPDMKATPFYRQMVQTMFARKFARTKSRTVWFSTTSEGLMLALQELIDAGSVTWAGSGKGEVAYRLK